MRIEASAVVSLILPASLNSLFRFSPLAPPLSSVPKPNPKNHPILKIKTWAVVAASRNSDHYLLNGIFGLTGDKIPKEKSDFA
jgi:hypothetical protein